MHSLIIRAYISTDRPACLDIFNSNVPLYFAPDEAVAYADWLGALGENGPHPKGDGENHYFVAEGNGCVVACGGWGIRAGADHATLVWGAVHRDFHNQGIGDALTTFRIEDFRQHYPELPMTIDTSHHTAPFYERFGFRTEVFTANGYAEGLHRHDMRLGG
jgi:ribosomal protein S18 acetylase RimI-like enzyme